MTSAARDRLQERDDVTRRPFRPRLPPGEPRPAAASNAIYGRPAPRRPAGLRAANRGCGRTAAVLWARPERGSRRDGAFSDVPPPVPPAPPRSRPGGALLRGRARRPPPPWGPDSGLRAGTRGRSGGGRRLGDPVAAGRGVRGGKGVGGAGGKKKGLSLPGCSFSWLSFAE